MKERTLSPPSFHCVCIIFGFMISQNVHMQQGTNRQHRRKKNETEAHPSIKKITRKRNTCTHSWFRLFCVTESKIQFLCSHVFVFTSFSGIRFSFSVDGSLDTLSFLSADKIFKQKRPMHTLHFVSEFRAYFFFAVRE